MIVNELITNAMKHAFCDGRDGELSVHPSAGEHDVTVIVQDNGPGIPDLPASEGPTSFGMTMVRALADNLRGKIRYEQIDGTRVVLVFPRYQ